MLDILKDKRHIFFDVGYTLDMPASGDWYFTNRFNEIVGDRIRACSEADIRRARAEAGKYIADHHLVREVEEEEACMKHYYSIISDVLGLKLRNREVAEIAHDRATNMENYIPYPNVDKVLEKLSYYFSLGIISDTWPSIIDQLRYIGALPYLTSFTFSCDFGVFKPDPILFKDAIAKCGEPAEDTVFIDDQPENLLGAQELKITPILIATNPKAASFRSEFKQIRSLEELLA